MHLPKILSPLPFRDSQPARTVSKVWFSLTVHSKSTAQIRGSRGGGLSSSSSYHLLTHFLRRFLPCPRTGFALWGHKVVCNNHEGHLSLHHSSDIWFESKRVSFSFHFKHFTAFRAFLVHLADTHSTSLFFQMRFITFFSIEMPSTDMARHFWGLTKTSSAVLANAVAFSQ